MARFKKSSGKGEVPGINTGSMSDIIFMFLFFFMVITTMRESTLFVKIQVPQATEVQKLEKKSLVSFIYVGPPIDSKKYGLEPQVQLNDQLATNIKTDIREFVEVEKSQRSEADRPFLTTSIKSDRKVKMGIITDIKQELRNAQAFKLNYSTTRRGEK